jgi:hypothetical protein
MQKGLYEDALSCFKNAIEKWPKLYEAHLNLGL